MSDPFELTEPQMAPKSDSLSDKGDRSPSYLDSLNPAQRKAVELTEGPVLVLAGAGTGKTRVLTTKLAHLLFVGNARPHEVLAVTFTNRAAREMKNRVEVLLDRSVETLWIGTFHSIAARILRENSDLVGLKSNFTILDSDDQLRLLKQLISEENIDEKMWSRRLLASIINHWKDRGQTPTEIGNDHVADFAGNKGPILYKKYQDRLLSLNAVDFGDLLLHNLTIFSNHEKVLEKYQWRFRYILVDEYQDTNAGQYNWLKLLAHRHKNICCVGDDDQSIYSWRGAEVGNILHFENDFADSNVIRLEQNYRSTPSILGAASTLISVNEGRLGKTLWTEQNEDEKVIILSAWDGEEEARLICDEIENRFQNGAQLGEFAILVRASFQTREFEERLLGLAIPYRVIGGLRFYEHREIKDAIGYLRVILEPNDDLAFERIINVPKRGIGTATIQKIHLLARDIGFSLTAAAEQLISTDELRPNVRNTLSNLINLLSNWRQKIVDQSPSETISMVLDESGYMKSLEGDRAPDAPGRLENLKELMIAVDQFENLIEFIEHVSLVMENDNTANEDKVSLMTLHGAKGLEFDCVYLPGWEEDLFPHPRALDEGGGKALEEERRLAHVAITRAKKRLTISFSASRRIYNQWRSSLPSRFIEELPEEHIKHIAPPRSTFVGNEATNSKNLRRNHRESGITSGGLVINEKYDNLNENSDSQFRPGERVFHQKFGYGTIQTVSGNRLGICFEKSGDKKVIDSFVEKI